MKSRSLGVLGSLLLLASMALVARADIRLPAVVGDHMVLQRDLPLPIWGWADPGEEVSVTFGEAKASAKADANGKWRVTLPAMKTGKALEMTLTGKNTIKLVDILIGEVWLGSGQSNMQWSVQQSTNAADGNRRGQLSRDPTVRRPAGSLGQAGQGRQRQVGRLHARDGQELLGRALLLRPRTAQRSECARSA